MKIEFTHDIIAKIVGQRVPAMEKRLKDIRKSIAQRLQAYHTGQGEPLGLKDLAAIEDYLDELMLSEEELQFIEESRATIKAKQEREKRINRNLRLYLALAVALLLISAVLGLWALNNKRKADQALARADSNLRLAIFTQGDKFLTTGNYRNAAQQFREYLQIADVKADTNYDEAARYLARAYERDTNGIRTITEIQVDIDSTIAPRYLPLFLSTKADIYFNRLADTANAEQTYIQAIREAQAPINVEVTDTNNIFYTPWHLANLNNFYDSTGLEQKLPQTLQTLIEQEPEDATRIPYFDLLANHYEEMDSIALAQQSLEEAVALASGDQLAYYQQRIDNISKTASISEARGPESITTTKRGDDAVEISNGNLSVVFKSFRRGYFTVGNQTVADFRRNHPELLEETGLSNSSIKVLQALSLNQGNLDAINTWDNSFLSFGILQWTINPGDDPGNLPILLTALRERYPDVFEQYFGEYRIGLAVDNNYSGYLTFRGDTVNTQAAKEQFRTLYWAFRFWVAGQDPKVQAVQIAHAYEKLSFFYNSSRYQIKGYRIRDLVSSEFGVALVLDNRINRPGYVRACLEKALEETDLGDPYNWSTAEEKKFIEAYLKIREVYGKSPMTNAAQRADRFHRLVSDGMLSDERGSFQPFDS